MALAPFLFESFEISEGRLNSIRYFACRFPTATLLHDDVVDDSALRRRYVAAQTAADGCVTLP